MKLRGHWVTVNSITRFVRDPEPPPPAPLRSHDYPVIRSKRIAPPRSRRFRRGDLPVEWKDQPNDLRMAHIVRHNELVRRRAAGLYDTPKLTPYARGLVATLGVREALSTASVVPVSMKGFSLQLEDSSFASFYYLGSHVAAGNPKRPADRKGLASHLNSSKHETKSR